MDGEWHVGENAEDLAEFLRKTGADRHEVDEIRHSTCRSCGASTFGIEGNLQDPEEAQPADIARRTCRSCGQQEYLADSGEYWSENHAFISACVCEEEDFEIAMGFSLYTGDNMGIRALAIATRCLACGKIGTYAEWMERSSDMTALDRA